ncbi:hypothetical protein GTY67_01840 [Streptomyces sp. SID8374]|uniref:DUF6332 family protein n=1 Tax=unclassified Streptomyces TaxID=2593676 RepID=UPI00081F16A8|nr:MULTISPECIES: DUF6332 family protein [unclassified Streptomyces]MYR98133.1 hypothetical protein [Streptomyces sp. SID4937]MYX12171.1 hypothetical protein [Streptomyces sp. SID8374]SCE34641.1 hypothetical protein GA0115243_111516 [Streptomyces sp. ScaeMP-e83]
MGERRTQAERDAMTVEIGYALATSAVLAGLTFSAISAPALLLLDLGRPARTVVLGLAAAAAVLAFATRVAHVLWRFPRREGRRLGGPAPDRPTRSGTADSVT